MDIKAALYGLLGKKKLGQPAYNVVPEQRGKSLRFRCEVRVPGIDYVGFGNSTNKRDAQTNAARDFANHLVQLGVLSAKDLPAMNEGDLVATTGGGGNRGYGMAPDYSAAALGGGGIMDVHQGRPLEGLWGSSMPSTSAPPPSNAPLPPPQPRSQHDAYVEQKADEVMKSESVDLTANIHGGWTMDNCRKSLNEWCQRCHLPLPEMAVSQVGNDQARSFVATSQLYVPQMQRTISGRGEGSSKKVALTTCSLTLVRQLFHMGVLPAADKVDEVMRASRPTADNLPPIKVHVDQSLRHRIRTYLTQSGLQPVTDGIAEATPDAPRSLFIGQKLDDFPPGLPPPTRSIPWAPGGQPNWNAWRAVNIDERPLALMTPTEISAQLKAKEEGRNLPPTIKAVREALPVFTHRQEILNVIDKNQVVLVKGTTGCGKSTQICQYLLESHLHSSRGAQFNCYVSQPRRISAITLAERVAYERGETVGNSIGYAVRFETVNPRPYGAVMFVTVGVLMRKMESGLRGVSHVIVDEIHERDVNTDFLLIVVRDMLRANPQLKVILMSATIDTQLFTAYFGSCPIVEIEQRLHHVSSFFLEDIIQMLNYDPPPPKITRSKTAKRRKKAVDSSVADVSTYTAGPPGEEENENEELNVADSGDLTMANSYSAAFANYLPQVKTALSKMNEREIPIDLIESLLTDIIQRGRQGSVLIFLPGWNLISMLLANLQKHPTFGDERKFVLLPLHSQLTGREQRKVFDPVQPGQRKIILSTNIAESSVTIDDVVYVIDSCRAREKVYSTRNNMVHFSTVWASRTSLAQRRGRAGRVQDGFCFHLCTRVRFDSLEEHRTAEILRTPLHEITLMIKLLRLGSVGAFLEKAPQPPPIDAVVEAEVLLREMGALDTNLELTALGRILARLPIEPRMGKTIVLGAALGIGDLMATLAAASSFNTPFIPRERTYTKLSHQHRSFSGNRFSDQVGLVVVNNAYGEQASYGPAEAEGFCQRNGLSATILSMSCDAKRQLVDVLVSGSQLPESSFTPYNIDPRDERDENVDLFLSLLVYAHYPNICHVDSKSKRRVFTLEQTTALMSKLSVCVPFNPAETLLFSSPLFVFAEKLRTSVVSCKQLSLISPLQLLLFGSRKVEAVGPSLVRLDDMVTLELDAKSAAEIMALRPCLESLVVRTCMHPAGLAEPPASDRELGELVRAISSDSDWLPTGEEAMNTGKFKSRFGRGGGGSRGRGKPPRSYHYPPPPVYALSGIQRPMKRPYDAALVPGMMQYGGGGSFFAHPPPPLLPPLQQTLLAGKPQIAAYQPSVFSGCHGYGYGQQGQLPTQEISFTEDSVPGAARVEGPVNEHDDEEASEKRSCFSTPEKEAEGR